MSLAGDCWFAYAWFQTFGPDKRHEQLRTSATNLPSSTSPPVHHLDVHSYIDSLHLPNTPDTPYSPIRLSLSNTQDVWYLRICQVRSPPFPNQYSAYPLPSYLVEKDRKTIIEVLVKYVYILPLHTQRILRAASSPICLPKYDCGIVSSPSTPHARAQLT